MSAPYCVICDKKSQPLTPLTDTTFSKCQSVLEVRKKFDLVYNNIVLPNIRAENHMYHRSCYQKFTALPPKCRSSLVSTSSRSSVETPESTAQGTSSTASPQQGTSEVLSNSPKSPLETIELTMPGTSCTASPQQGTSEVLSNSPRSPLETIELTMPGTSCTASQQQRTSEILSNSPRSSVETIESTMPGPSSVNPSSDDDELHILHEDSTATKDDTSICIFCLKNRKRIKGRFQSLHVCKADAIKLFKTYALQTGNIDLLNRLTDCENQNVTVFYHHYCKLDMANRIRKESLIIGPKTEWHHKRNVHQSAFQLIVDFVSENVVQLGKCCFLSFLRDVYVKHVKAKLPDFDGVTELRDLEDRLLTNFPRKIAVVTLKKKKIVKPFKGVLLENNLDDIEQTDILNRAAIILRNEVDKIKRNQLPEKLTASNLIAGECEVPDMIQGFYANLISTSSRRQKGENKQRLAKSFSEDLIYAVSNGVIKTSKHITLGMTLKSLTNSKQVINILNRLGHCCSYTVLEELETEATFASDDSICPEDIIRLPNLNTGLAFNNFDRYVDTLSGKDTLHDTVGIIFQNVLDVTVESNREDNSTSNIEEVNTSNHEENVTHGPKRKRQRSLDFISSEMMPYNKKPKYQEKLMPGDCSLRSFDENFTKSLSTINHAWVLCHLCKIQDMPSWIGFNSLIHEDRSCKQKVSYLTTINSSPTQNAVVHETMKQALRAASECGMDSIEVTYDLAIAKVALQIQSLEKPLFNQLFIHVGSFHIMMAYFKAVGKFIDGSGITNVMVNSEILASGSVNTFLSGKHFNRCKRLHPTISLALQILHFEFFLKVRNIDISEELKTELINFKNSKSPNPTIESANLLDILNKYYLFREETVRGEHGKTSRYFMIYIDLIENYLTLNYSIRVGNLEMFKNILPRLTNIFFMFNQQNYARYLVLYHEKLLQIPNSHPNLHVQLNQGSFGVKRTNKGFSRQPIDLTLEQTINADAANKLTGISYLTNSIAARQRWCKSHSIRSSIISHVMDRAGLRKCQDITADLEKSRIKKHHAQVQSFMSHIQQNMNPFSEDLDRDCLFNISTGQAATENIENFLLNAQILGQQQKEQFIKECSEDESRFERAIKKNKTHTFVDAVAKKKMSVNGKLVEVKMQRDLFGKLLRLSLENSLNIDAVLSYPLTPIPLSMCHVEGVICKTDKSVLFKILEQEIDNNDVNTSDSCDYIIYDGFFIVHQLKDVPSTFGNISKKLLQLFTMNEARTVIIVFDRYFSPSIKDNEHVLRGRVLGNRYNINGPEQKRPPNFGNELKNIYFKEALVNFLCNDWAQNYMAPFFSGKTVFVNYDSCYKFEVSNSEVLKTIDRNLSCPSHEEADTKMVFHVSKLDENARVIIRCSDTDVLIILLGNMPLIQNELEIRILAGTGNHRRYVDINKIYDKLGEKLCLALPAFHALTGCDYNPAFFRKGKKKPLTILRKFPKYVEAFSRISSLSVDNLEEENFVILEEFVCRVYGHNKINDINLVRVATFLKAYKVTEKEEILKINQNLEGSMLPPCKSELRQHFLRTSYIAQWWSNAYLTTPTISKPTDFGWDEVDGRYTFKWFEGEQLPKLDSITNDNDSEEITGIFEHMRENDEREVEKEPNIDDDSASSSDDDYESSSESDED